MTWSEIRDFVYQAVGWVVAYTKVAKSSAGGSDDEVEGRSAPDEPSYQIPVRRMWPFGLRSRPPAGVEAVVVHVNGGATKGVMVGAESAKYGPSDLEEGETAIYCLAAGAIIKLDKDGKISIAATDGKDVDLAVTGSGNINLTVASGKVYLGGTSGTEPVCLGAKTKDWLDEIKQKFADHTHDVKYTFVPGTGGASLTLGSGASSGASEKTSSSISDKGDVKAARAEVK